MNFLYWFGRTMSSLLLHLFHGIKVYGRDRVPKKGGIILACNHASHMDPPTVGVAVKKRNLHFMARSTLFKPAWFGKVIEAVNSHPIIRGKGREQNWDAFVNLVEQGEALLVFPEGTRTKDGELQRGKTGVGLLVHMCQVPVYPVYVRGTFQAWPKGGKWKPGKVSVRFGSQVQLEDLFLQSGEKRTLRQISDRVMDAISGLKKETEITLVEKKKR
ncbi:1-acyl-sn-glycerol-3-phosphate acyltransferase [bacterium]|nr:1-acyl-sn-glycerol-3-phosphate acyltransferase [bacterium]